MDQTLNPERLIRIAAGEIKPSDQFENLFLTIFYAAREGEEFMDVLVQVRETMNDWNTKHYDACILGYAYGQVKWKRIQELKLRSGEPSDTNH